MKWLLASIVLVLASNVQAQDVAWRFDSQKAPVVKQKYPYVTQEVVTRPFGNQSVNTGVITVQNVGISPVEGKGHGSYAGTLGTTTYTSVPSVVRSGGTRCASG